MPSYPPDQNQQKPSFDWRQFMPSIVTTLGNLYGAKMASDQMGQANQINQQNSDRLYQLGSDEMRRRDQLIQLLMPGLLRGMRYKNPMALNSIYARGRIGQNMGQPQPTPGPQGPPDPGVGQTPLDPTYYPMDALFRTPGAPPRQLE